jgi:glutamate/tyrosine decarboxylase-like PLP-dependent enzyme
MDSEALDAAYRAARRYLTDVATNQKSVIATATREEMLARFRHPLQDETMDAKAVIDDLVAKSSDGLLETTSGRFFAWIVGGALPVAIAAEWLTATWDQNAALYASGPAAATVEETVGNWLKDLFGIPSEASFALVTGCQMAHVTCLAAARHALLQRSGWDVETDGLWRAPSIRILTNHRYHGSIRRAARFLGFGAASIVELSAAEKGVSSATLHDALRAQPGQLAIVILLAGDINAGTYDELEPLTQVAHDHNAWVHVDGAFGLWAAVSERRRHLVRGIELADSWVVDGHKWLNVPQDCGYAFVRDTASHRAAMSTREAYLIHGEAVRDAMDWTPEWSRRARGFATYAALRQLGRTGISELVDRCCDLAQQLIQGIGALPQAEILYISEINQGLVRFKCSQPGATSVDHDRFTQAVTDRINASGHAFFTATDWNGVRAMRVSISNWRTNTIEIAIALNAVQSAIESLIH